MISEKTKILSGEPYNTSDEALTDERTRAQKFMNAFNANVLDHDVHANLLKKNLGHIGDQCQVSSPLYVDYGYNIFLGTNVFLN